MTPAELRVDSKDRDAVLTRAETLLRKGATLTDANVEELQGRVRLKRTGSKEFTRAATKDLEGLQVRRASMVLEDSESSTRTALRQSNH